MSVSIINYSDKNFTIIQSKVTIKLSARALRLQVRTTPRF